MKFLHTSDLLLGQEFAHYHPVAERVRAARIEALRTLLALACKEEADAVIVAGNLWADNRVGLPLIEEVGGLLSKSQVPVYLLPGHRDPLTADSPYELYPDRFRGQVKVLSNSEPQVLKGGVTLLPYPIRRRGVSGDPTRSMPERDREPLRIAVVNTSADGYRLGPGGLQRRELDFLFAGGEMERRIEDGIHWCGTPEPTDFGQQCGTVTMVELLAGCPAETRTVPVAGLRWLEELHTITDPAQLQEVASRWSKEENRSLTLLRLTLQGQLEPAGLAQAEELRRALSARLLHLDLRVELVPRLDESTFRHPLLEALAANLAEQASSAANQGEGAFSQAEVAREALAILLKTLRASPHQDLG